MKTDEAGAPREVRDDLAPPSVRTLLLANPHWLRADPELLSELGLRLGEANVVDFGPQALSRLSAAHRQETLERRRLEGVAEANFTAQEEIHAGVLDILPAASLPDLAARVAEVARGRFGLEAGVLAIEGDEAPTGWLPLVEGQVDMILGPGARARLGRVPTAVGLFGPLGPAMESVALVRLSAWRPTRQGVLAFGARDPDAFAEDMGPELLIFLARAVETIAERWPRP
jgi:uncharacterized protein YigA (DUF484 family)